MLILSYLLSRLCRSRPQSGDSWDGALLAQRRPGEGRVWPAGMSLSHRGTTDSCGRPGAVHGRQVYGVSSDTLVRLASRLSGHWVEKQCGLVGLCFGGLRALDLHLSGVRTEVAVTL